LRDIDREAERAQFVDMRGRVAARPTDDQIGFQRGDGFEVEARVAAHFRDLFHCFGEIAELDDPDQSIAGAGREDRLRQMRRQGYDAFRRLGQTKCGAAVIDGRNFGARQPAGNNQQQRNERTDHAESRTHSASAAFSPCHCASFAGSPKRNKSVAS
jgi:hypothetical protein